MEQPVFERTLSLQINGRRIQIEVLVSETLAEVLRGRLGLTGTKIACDQAACGACTVLVDNRAVLACHTLAVQVDNAQVRTIEDLDQGGALHPLQQAFIDHDALQCGYCTPGMIMALVGVLSEGVEPNRQAIAQAISGNICRCGAYEHILDAAISVLTP